MSRPEATTVADLIAHLEGLVGQHPWLGSYQVVLDRGPKAGISPWCGRTFINSAAETLEIEQHR